MRAAEIRRRIREGGRDVIFDRNPGLEAGEVIVLRRSPRQRVPMQWAVIEWLRETKPGRWVARVRRFEVEQPRTLRCGPLPYTDTERLRRDRTHPPTPAEIEAAREDSHYLHGWDPLDAGGSVGDEWLKRFAEDAGERSKQRLSEAIRRP